MHGSSATLLRPRPPLAAAPAGHRPDPADGARPASALPLGLVGALAAVVVVFPYVFGSSTVLRVAGVVAATLIIALETHHTAGARKAAARTFGVVVPAVLVLSGVSLLVQHVNGHTDSAMNLQRLTVTVPIWMVAGALVFRSPRARHYVRALVLAGLVAAVVATVEHLGGVALLREQAVMDQYTREGFTRGVAGGEHPLVLGTVLAALIPLVRCSGVRHHTLASLVLLLGVWSTGSRGPTAIAAVLLVVQVSPVLTRVVRRGYRGVMAALTVGLLLLAWLATSVWEPVIYGVTGTGYSTQYRVAIYALLPDLLREVPLGYGFDRLPAGRWLMPSELFGVRDLATTVDSELVYSALTLGVVGLALFVGALYVSVRGLDRNVEVGLAALAIGSIGFVLALHAWDSLGALWYLVLGGCLVRAMPTAGDPVPTGPASGVRRGGRRGRPALGGPALGGPAPGRRASGRPGLRAGTR